MKNTVKVTYHKSYFNVSGFVSIMNIYYFNLYYRKLMNPWLLLRIIVTLYDFAVGSIQSSVT